MEARLTLIAAQCLAAAHDGSKTFPAIVATLSEAGFEGYSVDYRRGRTTYYLPTSESVELPSPATSSTVAASFDSHQVEAAVREAQRGAPGYTYTRFCERMRAAGCAGYQVSIPGKRVVYFGRTAEVHVEHFPTSR